MANPHRLFAREIRALFLQSEKLYSALTQLRYEGRLQERRNIRRVEQSVRILYGSLKKHISVQERVIFPFFERHIPRYELAIQLLKAEHQDIRRCCEVLQKSASGIKAAPRTPDCGRIYNQGIYLTALLRHHFEFENQSVLTPAAQGLTKAEKITLRRSKAKKRGVIRVTALRQ